MINRYDHDTRRWRAHLNDVEDRIPEVLPQPAGDADAVDPPIVPGLEDLLAKVADVEAVEVDGVVVDLECLLLGDGGHFRGGRGKGEGAYEVTGEGQGECSDSGRRDRWPEERLVAGGEIGTGVDSSGAGPRD